MPLREFGGRAAGGALGLQFGNAVTGGGGNIAPVFGVPFGGVPVVVAVVLDPANNYIVIIRTVNALGFTAHVRQLTPQTSGSDSDRWGWTTETHSNNLDCYQNLRIGSDTPQRHVHENGGEVTNQPATGRILHDHSVNGDQAAGAGVTVMWMAVA